MNDENIVVEDHRGDAPSGSGATNTRTFLAYATTAIWSARLTTPGRSVIRDDGEQSRIRDPCTW
jgi:hypothetical protein